MKPSLLLRAALLAPLAILGVALLLWRALLDSDRAEADRVVLLVAANAHGELWGELNGDVGALARMAHRWEVAGRPPQAQWEADAAQYVRDAPEYQAVEWVSPDLRVRWVQPLRGNERALNLNLVKNARRAAAILRARNERRIAASRPIDLVQGGKGFLVYVPIVRQGRFEGLIVGVFRLGKLLEGLPAAKAGRTLEVIEGGLRAAAVGPVPTAWQSEWGRERPVRSPRRPLDP